MRRDPILGEAARPMVSLPGLVPMATIVFLATALWAALLWGGALLVHLNRTAAG